MTGTKTFYPCPACGFLQFTGPPGTYEICDICGWEDDHVQLSRPLLRGGANRTSLLEVQQEALRRHPLGVNRIDGAERDPDWRPLGDSETNQNDAVPGSGTDYFEAAVADAPDYYWKQRGESLSRSSLRVPVRRPSGSRSPRLPSNRGQAPPMLHSM